MMFSFLHLLRNDWRKSYRYHGGLPALGRCVAGHRRLVRGRALPESEPVPGLDCTVFSVVPEMSALWAATFERVIGLRPLRVLLGDCSGALRGSTESCVSVPMLNVHHGEKLDLFFQHLVRSDVVLVTDDDIFWLDETPLRWALDRLAEDPEIAVVSLMPKAALSSVLRGKVEHAMGSVLLIRRDVWTREKLSFRVVLPPPSKDILWHYDTGEFAQVELGRRGFRVEFAPEELRRHLVFFEGVSSWTLKIQKYSGELRAAIEAVPVRQEKALQTIFVLRGLANLLGELWDEDKPHHLVRPPILDRAQGLCEELLGSERTSTIHQQVEDSLGRLRRLTERLQPAAPLSESVRQMLGSRHP